LQEKPEDIFGVFNSAMTVSAGRLSLVLFAFKLKWLIPQRILSLNANQQLVIDDDKHFLRTVEVIGIRDPFPPITIIVFILHSELNMATCCDVWGFVSLRGGIGNIHKC
jgi:hypothetical protein